jgi:hypothetical protein
MCVIALSSGDSVREPRSNLSQEPESSLIGMNYQFVLIFADFKREEMRCHGVFSGLTHRISGIAARIHHHTGGQGDVRFIRWFSGHYGKASEMDARH